MRLSHRLGFRAGRVTCAVIKGCKNSKTRARGTAQGGSLGPTSRLLALCEPPHRLFERRAALFDVRQREIERGARQQERMPVRRAPRGDDHCLLGSTRLGRNPAHIQAVEVPRHGGLLDETLERLDAVDLAANPAPRRGCRTWPGWSGGRPWGRGVSSRRGSGSPRRSASSAARRSSSRQTTATWGEPPPGSLSPNAWAWLTERPRTGPPPAAGSCPRRGWKRVYEVAGLACWLRQLMQRPVQYVVAICHGGGLWHHGCSMFR